VRIIYPYPMRISNGYTYMLSIIQFLNALAERVQVDLLSLDSREDIKNYLEQDLGVQLHANLNVVQVTNKRFKVKSNKVFFIGNVIEYLETIEQEKIVIYTRDFKQMRLLIKRARHLFRDVQFIFEAHQILSQNYYRIGKHKQALEMRKLESYVFSNVDKLVCITSTLSSEIRRSFPDCVSDHEILPVGFNKRFLNLIHKRNRSYDFIYSGNFSEWKGLDILISAVGIIKQQYGRNVKGVLIGANKETEEYYGKKISELDLLDNIEIIPRLEHKKIDAYMARSKVAVLSNTYAGDGLLFTSPLKLYEYLGAGLKVVVSRLPSIESNIDSTLVYYARPESPQSFAKVIVAALDDSEFCSDKVRKFAENYIWEERARKFIEFSV
jgi:glycosyltransferase involved in cell wall biosynthesis